MKTILIFYISCSICILLLYLLRNKVWAKWIWYSLTYRFALGRMKKNLALLNENNRLLALVQWMDTEHWFKKYWFGKRIEKFVLKEIGKFK